MRCQSHHKAAFEKKDTGVEKHLNNAAAKADDIGLNDYHNRTQELMRQHWKLALAYPRSARPVARPL
jgi:hypothetical protein